ncbi:ABC transporter substrate-binding protein [Microbacterium rhizophilus]|uniref:ABC transporter substrate-binding protein n=1 Tax=Microbacterium rhizophilus TaxID=3138934 RepID=UPI0031E63501
MSLRRPLIALATAAAASLVLAGCTASPAGSDTGGETVTVTIGTLRGQPHFYAPFLYEDFAPEGVEFEVVTLDTTPALSDALVAGTVDFAVSGLTPTISSIAQGRDLKIVASAADGGSGFIGGDGIDGPEDLVGKTVGYIQGSAQEIAMRLTLEEAGVDPEDVDLITVPVPEMAGQFAAGDLDAFFGVEIGASIALQNGGHAFADPYATPIGRVNLGLISTGALIAEDPELVEKVVATHAEATEWMTGNEDEWLTEMVETFGGDQAIFDSAIENFWMRSDLSEEYQGQLEALATEMAELGFIDEAPAVDELVDASFVE